jgi:hypothetical protein
VPPLISETIADELELGFECEFDPVTNGPEFTFAQVRALGISSIACFNNDPSVSARIMVKLSRFEILGNISDSASHVTVEINREGGKLVVQIHILTSCQERMELSTRLTIPRI